MAQTDIQKLIQSLTILHQKFEEKDYQLSQLERNAATRIIEQLYTEFLVLPDSQSEIQSKKNVIESDELVEIKLIKESEMVTTETLNNEIDEVFNLNEPVKPVVSEPINPTPVSSANAQFQLGINEKIMFARELFDNDANALNESIRQLQSFQDVDRAGNFFDNRLAPFLLDEGKEEEIIDEYRAVLNRMYS